MKDKDLDVWSQEFNFKAGINNITLTPKDVYGMIASGNVKPNYSEVIVFIHTCKDLGLNPFLRDAYITKYSENLPATIVVGKNAFMKRAESHPEYKGFQAGLIIEDSEGNIDYKEGSFVSSKYKVIGGWCKVYRNDREKPFLIEVDINEYVGKKKDGTKNQQWETKEKTMIRKVAIVQCLREAFPQELSSMYVEEEFNKNIIDISDKEIKEEITPDHSNWKKAIESYSKTGNFDFVEKHYTISDDNKSFIKKAVANA